MTKLLGLSGSLRKESYNTKLMHEAIGMFGPDEHQIGDLQLPLYNEDVEAEGIPESVSRLVDQIEWADGLVISCPEYNRGPSGVMKNALDWISRVRPMRTQGKPTALLSAANGLAGGQRSKSAMYLFMMPLGADVVLGPEVNVGQCSKKFDERGNFTDEAGRKFLGDLMDNLKAKIAAKG